MNNKIIFKNEKQRRMFFCYVLNQVIFLITCLIQTIIRMSVSPSFNMGVEIQATVLLILSLMCLARKDKEMREWKKKRFVLSDGIKEQLTILDLKLKFNCSYNEAVDKYIETWWDQVQETELRKQKELESIAIKNRLKFKSIIKEVDFDEIPDSIKKRLEKAEKEVA